MEIRNTFAPQPQFYPMSIARMLWKQRWLALIMWLIVTGLCTAYVLRMPNIYLAEAVILVDSQKIPEKFVASTVEATLQDSLNAISQQVLTSGWLQTVIDKYNLYPKMKNAKSKDDLVEELRHDLVISLERGFSVGRPGAFRVSYEAYDPRTAAGVVNDVANQFVTQNVKTREQRAEGTSEFIENQLRQAKSSLDEQEAQLSEFKRKWAGELPQQEAALMGTLARLQSELQGNQDAISRAHQNKLVLESNLRFAESSLATLDRALSGAADAATAAGVIINSSRPSERLKAKLDELSQSYTDDHPEVKRVKMELAQAIADERAAAPANSSGGATKTPIRTDPTSAQLRAEAERQRERVVSTKTQIQVVEDEIASRTAERKGILQAIADYQSRVEKLPIREQQMSALTRDYETSKANYRSLLDKKISAEMATDMEKSQQSERFAIADPARAPEAPIKPKRRMLWIAGSMAGLAFGLCAGLVIELRKNTFLGEWELPAGVHVLGRVSISHS